ncbi:MAG: hypothetical protein ACKVOR_13120 [Flavobacteriales bacterium]
MIKWIMMLLMAVVLMHGCTIEKRRYMSGYYIDFRSHHRISDVGQKPEEAASRSLENVTLKEAVSVEVQSWDTLIRQAIDPPSVKEKIPDKQQSAMVIDTVTASVDLPMLPANQNSEHSRQVLSEVHPAAAGSLLMGILSAGCFVLMFMISFNPAWAVGLLVLGIITFAMLAKWLCKKAFDDMYYARNRYSGRGLAAAGLALGIISLVALLGLVLVLLFNLAFISIS